MNVLDEFSLGERLTQRDLNRFIDQGVPPIYLARTWLGTFSFLQRDRVVVDGGSFEFARYVQGGEPADVLSAFVFLLFDDDGQPADLAAWRPDGGLALWRDAVWALGQEQVGLPRMGEPLRVHDGVLDWLRAGREGIVVVNHAVAAWALRTTGTLAVETRQDADRLRKALTVPPPPIVVSPFVSVGLGQHADMHGAAA